MTPAKLAAAVASLLLLAVLLVQHQAAAGWLFHADLVPERPTGLPLPSSLSVADFEEKLFEFVNAHRYQELGWAKDKSVRDSGPFIDGKYYGTHPAVRAFYSPGVVRWLLNGRKGKIPDGEMIVKEQYSPPAARHQGKTDKELSSALESWTVMIKDSSGAHDGWFWSNPVKGQRRVDNRQYPFPYPASGFGLYCVRCHAATHSPGAEPASANNEYVFASLRNILGFPGQPLRFRVDDSWRKEAGKKGALLASAAGSDRDDSHPGCAPPQACARRKRLADQSFLHFFDGIKPLEPGSIASLPPVTQDWVTSNRDVGFVTSNQCMSCHAGLASPFGPAMFIPTGKNTEYGAPGWDVSPHGEWRWTPMALSGRDPFFLAQLENESRVVRKHFQSDPALGKRLTEALADSCFRCHTPMAKAQFDMDRGGSGAPFSPQLLDAVAANSEPPGQGASRYGALARDGVGCVVCHRLQPPVQPAGDRRPYLQYFLDSATSGALHLGPKGSIYGPFKDDAIAPYVMEHATGLKPAYSEFLKSSQLCAACHIVTLPALNKPADKAGERAAGAEIFRQFEHHLEQSTYLEWLNSAYENEVNKRNPQARSCQDCHMARGVRDERHNIDISQIRTRIAVVQDMTYPEAENLAAQAQLDVRFREDRYRRHNFSGLNVFLLELFNQFDDILGVARTDFMTGSDQGLAQARDNFVRSAASEVASLDVSAYRDGPRRLSATVVVTNKVGHRFPSGVGFRRAFLEFLVLEKPAQAGSPERILWSSGRTNELGIILDGAGRPLPTEFFEPDPASGRQRYQKHHQVITSPDEVQIYEALRCNTGGEFMTSFTLACNTLKDNRLLPKGWKKDGPGTDLEGHFGTGTHPDRETARAPRYTDGSGTDQVIYRVELPAGIDSGRLAVRATLYYQAVPPYYLRNLFQGAPDGPATRRLHYLLSHVNLHGTPIENWKLRITSAECGVARTVARRAG